MIFQCLIWTSQNLITNLASNSFFSMRLQTVSSCEQLWAGSLLLHCTSCVSIWRGWYGKDDHLKEMMCTCMICCSFSKTTTVRFERRLQYFNLHWSSLLLVINRFAFTVSDWLSAVIQRIKFSQKQKVFFWTDWCRTSLWVYECIPNQFINCLELNKWQIHFFSLFSFLQSHLIGCKFAFGGIFWVKEVLLSIHAHSNEKWTVLAEGYI